MPLRTRRSASLSRLQIGKDALDGQRTRVAAVAQIEDEAGIANGFPAEAGWSDIAPAQEFFHLSQQMYVSFLILYRLGNTVFSNAIPTCLGTYLSLKAC